MSKSEMANSEIRHTVTTGATKENYSFEWKIKNFLVVKSSDCFGGTEFQFLTGSCHGTPLKWGCRLTKTVSNKFGIEMCLINHPKEFLSAVSHYKFMIMKPNGEVFNSNEVKSWSTTPKNLFYNLPILIPLDEVLMDVLWEDGSILIKVNLELYNFTPVPVVQPNEVDLQEELNNFEKLELQKLRDFMAQTIESDSQAEAGKIINIVSKDNKEFYGNAALLSAGSPVFQAMFTSQNWKEGQGSSGEATLFLEDLSGKTGKVLLHYLMCGVLLKEDWKAEDVILELTYAADKYQLERLTQFLDKVLPALDYEDTKVVAKLALLASRLGMKNCEEKLLVNLKETGTTIDELVMDKAGSLIEKD